MVADPFDGGLSLGSEKSGRDSCITPGMIALAFSERGSRHISADKPCQDSSMVRMFDGGVFICAADGHGGEDYIRSGIGSRLCCEAAYMCMTDDTLLNALSAAGSVKQAEKLIAQLKKSIICRWNEYVSAHFSHNPLSMEELEPLPERTAERYRAGEYIERMYGTTMLAAVIAGGFCLVLQLGDGQCVALRDGEYISPMPKDDKCVFNQTTSMCDRCAFAETRHCFFARLSDIPDGRGNTRQSIGHETGEDIPVGENLTEPQETGRYYDYIPEALFLCTDGISNSFSDNEGLYNFYYMVTENLCETYGMTAKEKGRAPADGDMDAEMAELREFISIMSRKGSGDDVSLASVIHVR